MTESRCGDKKGSVLVMAVVLSFSTVLLGVTFLSFVMTLRGQIDYEIASQQALYDAHAGAMMGVLNKLAGGLPSDGDMKEFYDFNETGYRYLNEGYHDIDYGVSSAVRIVGQGHSTYQGSDINKELMVEFSFETYADFLYLSHRERDSLRHVEIYFWSADTLDGKVHSNDTIRVTGTPVFKEKLTTTKLVVPINNNAVFRKGKGKRAPIFFPDQALEIRMNAGYTWGTAGNDSLTQLVLSGPYIYVRKCGLFNQGGRDSIRCLPDYISAAPYYHIPPSGVVFVYGKTLVTASRGRGDLMDGPFPERVGYDENFISDGFSGQLTIGSSDTMIIGDNIVYQHAKANNSVPSTMDSCADVLGLVSENYIMVGRQVRPTVYINAAMAAVRGSISVQDIYMNRAPGWDNEKQSLTIWGSLAQRNRGIVHTTSFPPGHERGFIEKDYHYDIRLHEHPPPHFLPTLQNKTTYHEELFGEG